MDGTSQHVAVPFAVLVVLTGKPQSPQRCRHLNARDYRLYGPCSADYKHPRSEIMVFRGLCAVVCFISLSFDALGDPWPYTRRFTNASLPADEHDDEMPNLFIDWMRYCAIRLIDILCYS
jgi:hypothetical protein